jgi:phospholipase C
MSQDPAPDASAGAAASDRPASAASPDPAAAITRRRVLAGATALAGAAVAAVVLPASLRNRHAETARIPVRRDLRAIEHIVILMQENRSFDHYFGTMPGVRGFADPAAMRLPGGRPVFCQPDPSHAQGYLLPFHLDTATSTAAIVPDTDHSWETQHQAWDNGRMDQWVTAKGPFCMGYYAQADIPFHWALARAFTLCDNYYCSVMGPTNPNRLYMWSGTIDPAGAAGGPITDNTVSSQSPTVSWTTYPERLQAAGISWRVYQEKDNFDDNALAWFRQFAAAPRSSPLYQNGMRKLPAGTFEDDARHDRLPQVSWLVAPAEQSEHPPYLAAAGAEYIASKLDAIAANPDVWAKTVFILCYDENDGLFDHVAPPVPPPGTPGEFVRGQPIGLGFRTPTTIVSPWTAGGRVCSAVFDHTSLIRFIEARFGVLEPNITAWRRRTCGDLTAALRLNDRRAPYPAGNPRLGLAAAQADLRVAQGELSSKPEVAVPKVNQPLPRQ